jgi:hypothetical protein
MSIEVREGFPEWAYPTAWAWAATRRECFDDFFPADFHVFVEEYSVRFRTARTYALWKNGSIGGVVILEAAGPCVATAHILLSRRLYGTPAAELAEVARRAFTDAPKLIRIQAFIPAWNRLAIALCKRLGAVEEGTLRAATLRAGRPADAVVLGLTRRDWDGIESRRIVGRNDQLLNGLVHTGEHVQSNAGDDAGRTRDDASGRLGGVERGDADAGNAGDGDDERQPDQPDGEGGNGSRTANARRPRARAKRANGASDASGRVGARKHPRH